MATKAEVQRLQAENEALRADNKRLRQKVSQKSAVRRKWRSVLSAVLGVAAVVLLTAANPMFWAGNTVVKTDRFVEATAPVIEQPEVQSALAQYTADQLFNSVDVQVYITEALPPRADFLAPTLTKELKSQTQTQLQNIAASDRFQSFWRETLATQHANLIKVAANYKGDGTIDLNDIYQRLSQRLDDTKLSFLAGKQLPENVGSITVVQATWLPKFHNLVAHIDLWRALVGLATAACFAAAVALSHNRRRSIYLISAGIVVAMIASLVAIQIGQNEVAGSARPQFAEAARVAYETVTNSLVVQTALIGIVAAIIAFVAWISGGSRLSVNFRGWLQAASARTQSALFGPLPNGFLLWVGQYKAVLQWSAVAIAGISLLAGRLTPERLLWCSAGLVVIVIVIEVLAAHDMRNDKR